MTVDEIPPPSCDDVETASEWINSRGFEWSMDRFEQEIGAPLLRILFGIYDDDELLPIEFGDFERSVMFHMVLSIRAAHASEIRRRRELEKS